MKSLTSPANCLEIKEMAEGDAIMLLLKASCLDINKTDDPHEKAGVIINSRAINIKDYLGIYDQQ